MQIQSTYLSLSFLRAVTPFNYISGDEQVWANRLNRLLDDAWTPVDVVDFENIFSFNGNKYRHKVNLHV